jgi:hypothetical protein
MKDVLKYLTDYKKESILAPAVMIEGRALLLPTGSLRYSQPIS